MTSIERTAYPRFKRQFTTKELTDIYTPTFAEIAFAYNTTKGESNILNLLVILKSFQRLGYFPSIADIPLKIINHIRSHLKLALDIVVGYENNKTMYRHRTAIREYLQVKSFNQAINAYKGNNYFPLLWQFYKSHRSTFFRLLGALKFSSTTNEQSVVEALNFILENQSRRGQFFDNTIDLDFASPQWQKLLFVEQGNKTKIVRRHLEVCVFSYLMAELRSGDICVKGSENYADHREQLLPWSECLPLIDQYCGDLGFASDAVGFVEQLKFLLTDSAAVVDAGYPDNRQLVINDLGEPVLKKSPRHDLSPSAKTLLDAVEQRFGERNLIDILRNVDYWTNFTRHFGPMSGSDPKLERATERYLLTSFTYGCNLGPTQAARHMRGIVTSKEISFVNRRHVSVDKLNAALVDIINRYNVLKLPSIWGDGTTAAADGTKYELYEENLLSEYHIRYGGYGGIAYHHVSDTYVALFSHFISCGTWEAVYIIEGLLKNLSDIQPHTIHADTQGQSTPVFALSHMLGIKLMPRIRNWKDLNFFRPDNDTVYKHAVLNYLKNQTCLLIWDNFEPVAGFPAGNEPLLSANERENLQRFLKDLRSGKSWVLITSRREESWLDCAYSLNLQGLREQDVEELAAKILQMAGVDRAKLPKEYLDLLKLLGGHPLSLRVILPHLKTQTPSQLIEALRLGLDTFSGAEEEGRDKSLTVSLDYSFAKLSEQARRHLPFLGLFSEHINVSILPAFSEVYDLSQAYQTIFGENIQKSDWFRILNEAAEAGILEQLSESIYKIHPALPWYLRQQLSNQHTAQEVSNLEKKLLVFYGVLATVCGQKMISKADTATNVLLTEESNLLQNLRLAERQQEWDNARLMLSALGEIYQRQNHTMEFRALRQKIIKEIDTKFEQSNEAFKLWAYLQAADAEEAFENRDIRKASNVYQKISSELARLNYQDMNVEIAVVEQGLAKVAEEQQDFETAHNHYIKAIEILELLENIDQNTYIENRDRIAYIYQNLGYMADKQGDYSQAKTYAKRALKIFTDNRNFYGCAGIYNNLGKIEHLQSHFEEAGDYYKQALEIYEKARDFNKAAIIYHNLGRMAHIQQDFETADTWYKEALRIHEDNQDLYNASDIYQGLGEISNHQGDFDTAIAYFEKALEARYTANDWQKVSLTLNTWGQTLEAQENWNDAMEIYIHAFAIDFRYNKSWIGLRIKNLARMLKQLGESQFDTIWQEVTSEDCPEVLREAIWSARDNLQTE